MKKAKLIRITTVPLSLDKLLEGQLKYMSKKYDVISISDEDNGYLQRIAKRENTRHYPVKLTRAITPIADLKALIRLTLFLRKEKPEIVHSHTPKAGTIGMLAAKIAGVPIRLHTVAGLPLMETTGTRRRLLNFVEKVTYGAAHKILPNSFGLLEIIVDEKFTKKDKLHVIGNGSSNGIDTDYFSKNHFTSSDNSKLKSELNIAVNDFVFVFVGRLVKDKGIEELVKAFGQLAQSNLKLILVGPFEHNLDPLSQEILEEIENNKNIVTTGWQNDVRPFFAISDALVFPSYREGFPNVVMQAGAMELPSIVSNINGCNEIIKEGINGKIIPVKNADAIKNAMISFMKEKDTFVYMKNNARKRIVDNYSRPFIWEEIDKYYQQALNKRM